MSNVRLENVNKYYKENHIVFDMNLEIKDKEFLVIVGPSGCGKSTTIRMIAGLEEITSGRIYIDNKMCNFTQPKDRDVAMVFQNYALYPNMNVYDNIAFSLRSHKVKEEEIDKKVREVAEILEIDKYLARKPKALSGGQRQRVALARAIARNPKVFLMDEPLSNLDAKLRAQTRAEIVKIHKRIGVTSIYVTHDQIEAMAMADRIVVMNKGVIQQCDTPSMVYDHPANLFVATFLGTPDMNIFNAKYKNGKLLFNQKVIELNTKQKELMLNYDKEDVIIGIRPSDVIINNQGIFESTIDVVELIGSEYNLFSTIDEKNLIIVTDNELIYENNQKINFSFNIDKLHLFDIKTEETIY